MRFALPLAAFLILAAGRSPATIFVGRPSGADQVYGPAEYAVRPE